MVFIEGSIKAKNMLGYIKIKNVCVSKDTINRMKIKWNGKKYCKSGKGLISGIIKTLPLYPSFHPLIPKISTPCSISQMSPSLSHL